MNSIRKKFYITYILITGAGAIGLRGQAEAFLSLPSFFGISAYSVLLGVVYLAVSVILLEYFVMARIQTIKKDLQEMSSNNYSNNEQILNLSSKDEVGEIVSHINDILTVSHKNTEKTLRKNVLYLSLVEDPSIYVYRFKEDGTVTFVNKSYASMTGLNYKDMVGNNIFELISDTRVLKEKIHCLNPSRPTMPISIEMPKILREDAPKWIAWNASAVFDKNGKALEFQVVGINMHHPSNQLDAMAKHENTFLLNVEGVISYVNDVPRYGSYVGDPFSNCLHEEDKSIFTRSLDYVKSSKLHTIKNLRVYDGERYVTCQILIEPSIDKTENISSISVKTIDITKIEGAQAEVVGAVNNMNRLLKEQVSNQ